MIDTLAISVKKHTVLGVPGNPFSSYTRSEGTLKLYDKDARPVSAMLADDRCRLYESLLAAEDSGYSLVQATIPQRTVRQLQVTERLDHGVALALAEGRGMILHRDSYGDLVFYCVIQHVTDRIKLAALDQDADETIRYFLKDCFAGWHHLFHEVVATAPGFWINTMEDVKIDELVQLIQVPQRFPA